MTQIPTSLDDVPELVAQTIDQILARHPTWFVTHQRDSRGAEKAAVSRIVFNSPGSHPAVIIESAESGHRVFHLNEDGTAHTYMETESLPVAAKAVLLILDDALVVPTPPSAETEA
jgi:hypothetical protein